MTLLSRITKQKYNKNGSKLNFKVNPHMLRHSTGYFLANKGCDTRLIQDYLEHRNITHTVRYTRTAAHRFEGLWR